MPRHRADAASSARTWHRVDGCTESTLRRPRPAAARHPRIRRVTDRDARAPAEVIMRKRSSSPRAAEREYCSRLHQTSSSASSGAPIAPAMRSRSSSRATSARSAISAVQSMRSAGSSGNSCQVVRNTDSARVTAQMPPHLLGGERQDRRQPAHHALGDVPHRGLRRAARAARGRGRVKAILQNIEIEAAQIDHAEVVDLLIDQVECVVAIGLRSPAAARCVRAMAQRSSATSSAAGTALLRIEVVQVAEQEAHVLRMRR